MHIIKNISESKTKLKQNLKMPFHSSVHPYLLFFRLFSMYIYVFLPSFLNKKRYLTSGMFLHLNNASWTYSTSVHIDSSHFFQ